jgi:hypothetical protein
VRTRPVSPIERTRSLAACAFDPWRAGNDTISATLNAPFYRAATLLYCSVLYYSIAKCGYRMVLVVRRLDFGLVPNKSSLLRCLAPAEPGPLSGCAGEPAQRSFAPVDG